MAKDTKKGDVDDAQGIVLRPFLRKGVKYHPNGPNKTCSDHEPSMFEGDSPLLILPSKLKDQTAEEARKGNLVERERKQYEARITDLENEVKALKADAEEFEQDYQALTEELARYKSANEELTAKIAEKHQATPVNVVK